MEVTRLRRALRDEQASLATLAHNQARMDHELQRLIWRTQTMEARLHEALEALEALRRLGEAKPPVAASKALVPSAKALVPASKTLVRARGRPTKALPPPPASRGACIRRGRQAAGLSQTQLGRALGCTPASISNWESNRYAPASSFHGQLFRLLGVPVNTLRAA